MKTIKYQHSPIRGFSVVKITDTEKSTCPNCKVTNVYNRSGYKVCFTCGHQF